MHKVLLITYYWPPAGGPGVQRWLQMLKHLPEHGFEISVWVPKNPFYPIKDSQLIQDIPDNIEVIKSPIREPGQFLRWIAPGKTKRISSGILQEKKGRWLEGLLLSIRGNLFIPDARIGWVKPSIRKLIPLVQKRNFQTVITTGPPHSLHLIGLELQKSSSIKWVADFRDPWTSIGYHDKLGLGARARRKHLGLEKKVLQSADQILVTSPGTKKEFETLSTQPIEVLTNGYESLMEKGEIDADFTLSHIGSLLSGRNPKALWEAIAELKTEIPLFAEKLKLQLAGTVSEEVIQTIRKFGLEENLVLLGYRPHSEVRQLQARSQVLLLLEINQAYTTSILPGKLFEYMASLRPILAVGPQGWDARTILEETQTGSFFGYDQKEDLKAQLKDWFARYQSNTLNVKGIGIDAFSRQHLSAQLASILAWE